MLRKVLFILYLLSSILFCKSQEKKKVSRLTPQTINISYGYGTEDNFLFNDSDYTYETNIVRVSFYYPLNKRKYQLGFSIQPQIHFLKHQLKNKFFIQPNEDNFEVLRDRFTQLKQMQLYALQGEISIRKKIAKDWQVAVFGAIGPAIVNTETERLSKGFTFIENLGLEINYFFKKQWFLKVNPNYNHVSNANLQQRNSGYNSLNIEFGLGFNVY